MKQRSRKDRTTHTYTEKDHSFKWAVFSTSTLPPWKQLKREPSVIKFGRLPGLPQPLPHNISNTAKARKPYSFNIGNRHISFCCTWQILCFIQTEGCGNTELSKSLGTIFSIAFVHFVFVPPFGNSSNISSFFIIILFVRMICDQWFPILLL